MGTVVVMVVAVVVVVLAVAAVVVLVVGLVVVCMVLHQGAARLSVVADTLFLLQDSVGREDKVCEIQGSQLLAVMEEMDIVYWGAPAEGSLDWGGDGLMGRMAGQGNK
jgi:uncharacterized oligopeptide transporter (OPT) family protein